MSAEIGEKIQEQFSDKNLAFEYYSRERIESKEARETWLKPDLRSYESREDLLRCCYRRRLVAAKAGTIVLGSHFHSAQAIHVFETRLYRASRRCAGGSHWSSAFWRRQDC